jgi:hypothetical protein
VENQNICSRHFGYTVVAAGGIAAAGIAAGTLD